MAEPKKPILPSDAELAILGILWKNKGATAKEIHEALNVGRRAPRVVTTTAKLLQIMQEKGLVTRDDEIRPHRYRAAVTQRAIQHKVVKKTVTDVFDKSAGQFILAALESGKPSAAELEEIKAMLADYEERQKNND